MKLRVWHVMLAAAIIWGLMAMAAYHFVEQVKRSKFYQCCSVGECLKQHHHGG